jgi:hypothetical protein
LFPNTSKLIISLGRKENREQEIHAPNQKNSPTRTTPTLPRPEGVKKHVIQPDTSSHITPAEIPEEREKQSISHPPPPTLQRNPSHQSPYFLLINIIKHTRAEDLPHLSRSISNVAIRLRRERTAQAGDESRLRGWGELAGFHLGELGFEGAVDDRLALVWFDL